ncbi:hypothetical protein J4419_06405 [Candidatus Woesearchaeota archaeon]|nr:hypothetical protein [Candidatus Woesearchaeota archaeon]
MKKPLLALLLAGCGTLPVLSPEEEAFQKIMLERASTGREDAYLVHLETGEMRSIGYKRDARRVHFDPAKLAAELEGEGYGLVHPHSTTGRMPAYQAAAALPSQADLTSFLSQWADLRLTGKNLAFIVVSEQARVWLDLDLSSRSQEALSADYLFFAYEFDKHLPSTGSRETLTTYFAARAQELHQATGGALRLRLAWKPE